MNEDIGNLKGASGSSVTPVNANKVPGTQLATTVDKSNHASRKKFAAVDDVATNKIKEAKQVGIESSGELVRRLAVNESVAGDDDDENDDGEKDSDAASKVGRKRSAQLGSA
ncbi:hypothetical protein PInf_001288 [Phytophthora infestans]|nr:hypothetical protein PInf_001228 [Phytophthora infestans]KAI9997425.1 hypothetical protein PInf_001288 [Phytophthora infestans]